MIIKKKDNLSSLIMLLSSQNVSMEIETSTFQEAFRAGVCIKAITRRD